MRLLVSIGHDQAATSADARGARVRAFARITPRAGRALTAVVLSAASLCATGGTALAGTQATATISVVAAVKSVTVSVSTLTYGFCNGGSSTNNKLGFPNAQCFTVNYTVTNGTTAAQIDVAGSDAVPSSGGTPWALCGGLAPACLAPSASPGQDQYKETVFNGTAAASTILTNGPQCDGAFSHPTCGASTAGASDSEALQIYGPTASSDGSSTFTSTITYTAV